MKNTAKWGNLILAFLLELFLVFIYGYWGFTFFKIFTVNIVAGLGLPLILILLWWQYFAPRSSNRLADPWLSLGKVVLFTLGALALVSTGAPIHAAGFWFLSMLNVFLLYIYR